MRPATATCLAFMLLCPATVPAQGHPTLNELLTKAREADEAGRLFQSVMHLRAARKLAPDNKRLTKLLAVTHTRAGNELYKKRDLALAYSHFCAADRLAPNTEGILQSLGVICYEREREFDARRYMERVLRINPKNSAALTVLGNYARDRDDVQQASEYLNRASAAKPDRKDLKSLADKLDKEARVEKTFLTRVKGHFRVQYQGGRDAGVERNINLVFGRLETARTELCRQLGARPTKIITVVVYTQQQYQEVRSFHTWARAYYDGKIRIAVRPNTSMQQNMRGDLRHELTHALLFELFPKAPLWVHEGYAQLIEGKSLAMATGRFASGAQELLPTELFLDGFTESKQLAVVERGYAQSLMAVGFLRRAGSHRKFRSFLRLVGQGISSDDALRTVYRFDVATMLRKAARK